METVSDLKIKESPLPKDGANKVALLSEIEDDYLGAWTEQFGKGEVFYCRTAEYAIAIAEECSVAIFNNRGYSRISAGLADRMRPFFIKGGSEANVFEFDIVTRHFIRRTRAWFDTPGRLC